MLSADPCSKIAYILTILIILLISIAIKKLQMHKSSQFFAPLLILISMFMGVLSEKTKVIMPDQKCIKFEQVIFVILPLFVIGNVFFFHDSFTHSHIMQVSKVTIISMIAKFILFFLMIKVLLGVTSFNSFATAILISFTDYTAIQEMLKTYNISKKLRNIILEENKQNVILCFSIFSIYLESQKNQSEGFLALINLIISCLLCSIFLGVLFGISLKTFLNLLKDNPLHTFNITVMASYLLYFIAQYIFSKTNGVIALITMSYLLKNIHQNNNSIKAKNLSIKKWKTLSFLIQSTLYIIYGLQVGKIMLNTDSIYVIRDFALGLILTIISYCIRLFAIKVTKLQQRWTNSSIVALSGLKGVTGVLISLMILVHEGFPEEYRRSLVFYMIGSIFLSLIINPIIINRLMNRKRKDLQSVIKQCQFGDYIQTCKEKLQQSIKKTKDKQFQYCDQRLIANVLGLDQLQRKNKRQNQQIQMQQIPEIQKGLLSQQSKEINPNTIQRLQLKFNLLIKVFLENKLQKYLISRTSFQILMLVIDFHYQDDETKEKNPWQSLIANNGYLFSIETLLWLYKMPLWKTFALQQIYLQVYDLHQILTTYMSGIQFCEFLLKNQKYDREVISFVIQSRKYFVQDYYFVHVSSKFPELIHTIKSNSIVESLMQHGRDKIYEDYRCKKINKDQYIELLQVLQKQMQSVRICRGVQLSAYHIFQHPIFKCMPSESFKIIMENRKQFFYSQSEPIHKDFDKMNYVYFIGKGQVSQSWVFPDKFRHRRITQAKNVIGLEDAVMQHRQDVQYQLKAASQTIIHAFPRKFFEQIMMKHKQVEKNVYNFVFPFTLQLKRQLNRKYFLSINKQDFLNDYQFGYTDKQATFYENGLHFFGNYIGILKAWMPFCRFSSPYKLVRQGTKGLLERFGKYVESLEPGLHFVNPYSEKIVIVSLLSEVYDLENQLALTKDNISVNIETCVFYRVIDAKVVYYTLNDLRLAISQLTYTALRTICGQNSLQDLLERREQIDCQIAQYVQNKSSKWGIYVENVFIKNITIEKETLSELSMVSRTQRLSKAKIISATADVSSAKLLSQVSDILNSKAAMQIRHLETLESLSKGEGHKTIFLPLSYGEEENHTCQ